jgi:DNA mismatch endonuclease (patch repair protein)
MPDVFSKAKRSEVMSRIRSRGNRDTELALARLLRAAGICGWRRHLLIRATVESSWLSVEGWKSRKNLQLSTLNPQPPLTVRPDFVFLKSRTAIFVDGCFWHGCPKHATKPANNKDFWKKKLAGNKKRDRVVNRTLRRAGWRVVRIWECELTRTNEARLMKRLKSFLKKCFDANGAN